MCKLKKTANGPKEQLGGEEDVLSDMEGADEDIAVEDDAPQKGPPTKAGKRKAAEIDVGKQPLCDHAKRDAPQGLLPAWLGDNK